MEENVVGIERTETAKVKVVVRIRPLSRRSLRNAETRTPSVVVEEGHKIRVVGGEEEDSGSASASAGKTFAYGAVFGERTRQEELYEGTGRELIGDVLEGFNACVFAYGQTGSGKSHTMIGGGGEERGFIPRMAEEIFAGLEGDENVPTYSVSASFLEVYNEQLRDLLGGRKKTKKTPKKNVTPARLRIREHPVKGPFVEGLSVHGVEDVGGLVRLIEGGLSSRVTASTQMNATSSRSHAIVTLIVEWERVDPETEVSTTLSSRVHLVDLAGSERVGSTGASGLRLKEAGAINKSLHMLGRVIVDLADGAKYIPYRDSVLTRLLQDSLGGNSKTVMIATISPSRLDVEETVSTLRYAARASTIVNEAVVNEDPMAALIRNLRGRIAELEAELAELDPSVLSVLREEVEAARADAAAARAERDDAEARLEEFADQVGAESEEKVRKLVKLVKVTKAKALKSAKKLSRSLKAEQARAADLELVVEEQGGRLEEVERAREALEAAMAGSQARVDELEAELESVVAAMAETSTAAERTLFLEEETLTVRTVLNMRSLMAGEEGPGSARTEAELDREEADLNAYLVMAMQVRDGCVERGAGGGGGWLDQHPEFMVADEVAEVLVENGLLRKQLLFWVRSSMRG